VPRRVSLPGADELFRTTGGAALQSSTPRQHPGAETAPPAPERLRPLPATGQEGAARPAGPQDPAAAPAPERNEAAAPGRPGAPYEPPAAAGLADHARPVPADPVGVPPGQRRPTQEQARQQRRRERREAPNRRPSGRERHDEKITVYVSAEELMDLEHARLVLRGEHGLAVDRGRIVREAVAVVLADLESRGEASILVRRLRGR